MTDHWTQETRAQPHAWGDPGLVREGLLEVDPDRVRLWLFARAAAEQHDSWDEDWLWFARALAS